jgi:hypothetical protein
VNIPGEIPQLQESKILVLTEIVNKDDEDVSTDIALTVMDEVSSWGFQRIRMVLKGSNIIELPSEYKIKKATSNDTPNII